MDELVGRNGAELRMLPTQECLESGGAAVLEAHQGLVVQLELVAGEGAAELALELDLVDGQLGEVGVRTGVDALEPATGIAKQILLVTEAVQDHAQEKPQN